MSPKRRTKPQILTSLKTFANHVLKERIGKLRIMIVRQAQKKALGEGEGQGLIQKCHQENNALLLS